MKVGASIQYHLLYLLPVVYPQGGMLYHTTLFITLNIVELVFSGCKAFNIP